MKRIIILLMSCILLLTCVSCSTARTQVYGEIALNAEELLRIQEALNGTWLSEDKSAQIEFNILNIENNECRGHCNYNVYNNDELVSSHSYSFKLINNILTMISLDDGTDITEKSYTVNIDKQGDILSLIDKDNETVVYNLVSHTPIDIVTID